jgi:hypothetical protein
MAVDDEARAVTYPAWLPSLRQERLGAALHAAWLVYLGTLIESAYTSPWSLVLLVGLCVPASLMATVSMVKAAYHRGRGDQAFEFSSRLGGKN